MFNTPNIIIIPFSDLPVFKLRCSLTHGIISCLSPVIFYFLSALTDKMSNFFAVITSAFVLIYSFTSNSRMPYIWAVIKSAPAPKSSVWFRVSIWVCPIFLIAPIIKILTPRSECAIILIPSVISCILSTLASIFK